MEKPPTFDGTASKLNNFKFKVMSYVQVVGLTNTIKI